MLSLPNHIGIFILTILGIVSISLLSLLMATDSSKEFLRRYKDDTKVTTLAGIALYTLFEIIYWTIQLCLLDVVNST